MSNMGITRQKIKFDKNLPAKITIWDGPIGECVDNPHLHPEMQLIYVVNGDFQITIGGRKRRCGCGEIVIINPNEIHFIKAKYTNFLSVHFSNAFVKQFDQYAGHYDYAIPEGTQEYREMAALMQKLLSVTRNDTDEYGVLMKHALLMQMLRLLLVRCRKSKQFSVYGSGKALEGDAVAVKNYIENNYRRKIFIAEVAEQTNHSAKGFATYFKKLTGKCFSDYVCELRVRHALEDYLTYNLSVGDAALRNGFRHYNHFSKACKKYYGASPLQLKKRKG